MSAAHCEREAAVLVALRSAEWSDGLRAHVAGCPACTETVLVAGTLLDDSRTFESEQPLPDPSRIWIDARRRARRLQAARALRPIAVVQRVAFACATAVTLALGVWLGPDLGRWLRWLQPPSPDVTSGLVFAQGLLLLAACGGFLVIAAYALFVAWREP